MAVCDHWQNPRDYEEKDMIDLEETEQSAIVKDGEVYDKDSEFISETDDEKDFFGEKAECM